MKPGYILINNFSGLEAVVLRLEPETDTIWLRLACGQEADYDLSSIDKIWSIKHKSQTTKQ